MSVFTEEISIKGRQVKVRAARVQNKDIIITGRFIKMARIKDEWDADVENPAALVKDLRANKAGADLLTFWQRLPEVQPKFQGYHLEWDNVAALPITSFEHWWNEQIRFKARNKMRKAEKAGVQVRVVDFSDELARGITAIYNEVPIRQGRAFWHYGKDFETVKRENATYLDRSIFIAADFHGELIGFIKFVNYGKFASIMQIVSMLKHRDKAPTNGLITKAVQVCAQEQIPYLVYSKFVYGKKGPDTLTDFKRSSGFEKIDIPRYYIPLTWKGAIALKLRMQHGVVEMLPEKLVVRLLGLRNKWNKKKEAAKDDDSERGPSS